MIIAETENKNKQKERSMIILDINNKIKRKIKEAGLYQYQVAKEVGISEPQFIRWLRYEMPDEKKQRIYEAIKKLSTKEGR